MATSGRRTAKRTTTDKPSTSDGADSAPDGKLIYTFSEGSAGMRALLGGKGAGLAEMTKAGLPVPPGFTITTEACNAYYEADRTLPDGLWEDVLSHMTAVEEAAGKGFGNAENPLLVSVRSGAAFSMPGMMDTVLNLGLNEQTVAGLILLTENERFGYDAWRRFVAMFGRIVQGIPASAFDEPLEALKEQRHVAADTDLTAEDLRGLAEQYQQIVADRTGEPFPADPYKQLELAIRAVFDSWFGKRAHDYREFNKIPHDLGTAVNIVTMVFGNMGSDSGTGVAFTRDPNTGVREIYGEYLTNAQGEDVVAGIRTPAKISQMRDEMPEVWGQFEEIAEKLERHYRDVQDLEFTIERGKLYMLQTRSAKRTAPAAVKIAVDMVDEGILSKEEALQRVDPAQIVQLLLPRFDEAAKGGAQDRFLAKGLNASPGAATGRAIFDPDRAVEAKAAGDPVILVRIETSPDDVHGMLAARGVLTARGGATSHAAVVARSMGLPCVAGAESLQIDYANRQMRAGGASVAEGDMISIDGTTGEIYAGELPTIEARFEDEHDLATLLGWADEVRRLQVWANADYPRDAERARAFGAQGIGLCRTEHMFFEEDRLPTVRRMILAATRATEAKRRRDAGADLSVEDRETVETFDGALAELEQLQTDDFAGLFRAMDGLPVVIRLIDPPLHEFLPSYEEILVDVTRLQDRLSMNGDGRSPLDAVGDRVTPALEKGLQKVLGRKDAGRAMKLFRREGKASTGRVAGVRRRRRRRRAGGEDGAAACRRGDAGAEPHARDAWLPAWPPDPGHHPDADPGDPRRGHPGGGRGADATPGDHDPAGGARERARGDAPHPGGRGGPHRRGCRPAGALQVRDHDRGPARRPHRRPDRGARRVLQLRDQRPDADDLRLLARRCGGQVPAPVRGPQDPAGQPLPGPGPGGRWAAGADGDREGPQDAQGSQDRDLR